MDLYFWGTDFLLEGLILAGLGPDTRKSVDASDEALGISQGMSPHPEELKLTPWAEPGWEEAGKKSEANGPVIPEYPPAE